MKRPAIGIAIENPKKEPEVFRLREDYVRSVETGGGLPLVFAPGRPEDVGDLLDHVNGLLLTGGADVDPGLYGARPHPALGPVFRDRDDFEIALCREALRRDLPLLAICRGHQVLNVATGGTLVQDIPSEIPGGAGTHDPDVERWQTAHDVEILPGTRLREILRAERVAVNSFHHQSIRDLGRDLVLSALSPQDGVVEGVEMPRKRFVVGVQWHPESFWDHEPGFRPLFEALVRAADGATR